MTGRQPPSTKILWCRSPTCTPAVDGDHWSDTPGPVPGPGEDALVQVIDPALPYRVLLRVVVGPVSLSLDSLEVRRLPDGPAVGTAVLRTIPVQTYLALINCHLGSAEPELPVAAATPGRSKAVPPPATRFRMRDVDGAALQTVARVYREALASSDLRARQAPTAAVARHFAIRREYAGRLVARARRSGELNPAVARRPGEAPSEVCGWDHAEPGPPGDA